jgi:HAD superfamily hydrolase (TIGR01490 family)
MKKVAFFDIDGTVFRSSLLIELVEALIKKGVFPEEVKDSYADALRAWRSRTGGYHTYIDAVVKAFVSHIKGVHYGDLADVGREVVAHQGQHVYRYTRDLIAELKREGYFLVAISQSPKTVVDEFAREYGFDKVYGRIYEIGPQDRFTGAMTDVHLIENKGLLVARVLEKEDVVTEDSIGVGDTEGDISLLESVAIPICFNPNKILFEKAKRSEWKVVVERKDVIYEL